MTNPVILTSLHGDLCGLTKEGHIAGVGLQGIHTGRVDGVNGTDYFLRPSPLIVEIFDDFNGYALDNVWGALKGSDGSCNVALQAEVDGAVRLTSGAGSTHTVAVNGAQIVGGKTWQAQGATGAGVTNRFAFEANVGKASALTSQTIFIGMGDAVTLNAPFTLSGTTLTANATNGVGFLYDAAGTGSYTNLTLVAVNAGGTPQKVAISNAISTTAFHKYRVELDGSGNANFYIDGALVGSIASAVAVTALLTPTVEMFSEATSASATLDVDYIYARQER